MGRFLAACGLALLLGGCAAETRYRIADFLFDGVPPPAGAQAQEAQPESPEEAVQPEGRLPQGQPPAAAPGALKQAAVIASTHKPFGERACASCHDRGSSNRLVREGNELCFGCHRGIITGKRVAHVPALAECLLCHMPHKSENVRLLQQPLPELCLMCHDREAMLQVHGEIGDCLSCHNPHESDEDRLLDFQ
jgi:predicted CXXCH cytochrome family protein